MKIFLWANNSLFLSEKLFACLESCLSQFICFTNLYINENIIYCTVCILFTLSLYFLVYNILCMFRIILQQLLLEIGGKEMNSPTDIIDCSYFFVGVCMWANPLQKMGRCLYLREVLMDQMKILSNEFVKEYISAPNMFIYP